MRGTSVSFDVIRSFSPNIQTEPIEMTQDIIESKHVMYDEAESSSRRSPAYVGERDQMTGLDTLGLTETEAVEYVLMLSRDEANDRAKVEIEKHIDNGVFEGDFDDEGREDALDDFNAPPLSSSASSGSASSSRFSVTTSPGLCGVGVGCPIPASQSLGTLRASPSLSPSNSSSNQKVQVSPPYQVEPMEAGKEWSEGDRSAKSTVERLGLDDHYFPPVVGTGIANSTRKNKRPEDVAYKRGEPSEAKPIRNSSSAWSTPLTKNLANRDSSASFAPSSSQSPNLSPVGSGTAQTSAVAVCDGFDLDDDLRVAIELSLAEASSRGSDS